MNKQIIFWEWRKEIDNELLLFDNNMLRTFQKSFRESERVSNKNFAQTNEESAVLKYIPSNFNILY